MKRLPVYADSKHRVVYVPGGLWQAQKIGLQKGTKIFDPWIPLHRPTDFATAKRQVDEKVAMSKVVEAAAEAA